LGTAIAFLDEAYAFVFFGIGIAFEKKYITAS
jgi:hypothetical protein